MLKGKDLLSIHDLSLDEFHEILALAKELKAMQKAGVQHHILEGKTLGMIFEKSSTRTRVSFETGMYQLGGQALFLSNRDLQLGRGEPIKDTARVLSRYLDGIMIRTFGHDRVEELAKWASVPVINAPQKYAYVFVHSRGKSLRLLDYRHSASERVQIFRRFKPRCPAAYNRGAFRYCVKIIYIAHIRDIRAGNFKLLWL